MHQSELRSRARWYSTACVVFSVLAGCASAPTPVAESAPRAASSGVQPIIFAVTGDGPRGEEDWTLLPQYFAAEKADGRARYLLHTGDLCKGSQLFDAAYSARVAALFRQSSIPVLFVVGDNEWNDQSDPWVTWPLWERDFSRFHEAYPDAPVVARQVERPENIAWLDDGVLFIGINMVGGTMHDVEEWGYRHRANAAWVADNLATHGSDAFAVVVFAQAAPSLIHEDFTKPFASMVAAFGKPVLYIHGDHHKWEYEEGWRAPNLTRIQVDQVSKARPVHIIVSPDKPESPFSFDRLGAGEVAPEGTS